MQSTDTHNVSTGWRYQQDQLFISLKQFFESFYPNCKIATKYFVFGRVVFIKTACDLSFNFWLEGIAPVIYYSLHVSIVYT